MLPRISFCFLDHYKNTTQPVRLGFYFANSKKLYILQKMSKTIHKIQWQDAHYLWSDFKLGSEYATYLLEEYGITVEATGRVRWDKVFTVEVIIGGGGGRPDDGKQEKKKEKRKIKLIFICGDNKGMIEKEVNDEISTQLLSDIRNKIQEVTKTQVILNDVQIIKG